MRTRFFSRPPYRSWRSSPGRRGAALVLVLWVMVVLGAVALRLAFSSHLRLQATATLGQGTQALFLARAGVERAIGDLLAGRDGPQPPTALYESETVSYSNVPLGDGACTLFAGYDETDKPLYGIMDESAKINVLTADAATLGQLPGMTPQLAAEIVMWRQSGELRGIGDLLRVEGMDTRMLYGEDANGNGLLDPNEDDGERSWPPDNADGRLDEGLAARLTLWSAARNVTSEGKARVNLNKADADALMKAIPGLKQEEADSIVAARGKKAFTSLADLLGVELAPKAQPAPAPQPNQPGDSGEKKSDSSPPPSSPPPGRRTSPDRQPSPSPAPSQPPGPLVFDQNRLKEIADYAGFTDDETVKGLVNINTAGARVLACLPGMTEDIAAEVVRRRESLKDGFRTVADLLDVEGMTADRFKVVCPYLSARSDVFGVHAFGVVAGGEVCRCVEATIDRTGKTARIIQWRELD